MASHSPGPYTLGFLAAEAQRQLPALLSNPGLLKRPGGADRVGGRSKLAAWLRLSRLEGCPVCIHLIPHLAKRKGLDPALVSASLEGRVEVLPAELGATVAYAEAVYRAFGEAPGVVPDAAAALTRAQREHLEAFVRLERIVHATGLLVLPHAWIRRAAGL